MLGELQTIARIPAPTVLLGALTLTAGCVGPQSGSDRTPAGASRQMCADLRDRALGRFDSAVMYKPRESVGDPDVLALAPLILWQVPDGVVGPAPFGAVFVETDGKVNTDVSQPTVYASRSTTSIGGREYRQLTFRWWGPRAPGATGRPDVCLYGFRMTLGADGFPLVWEPMDCGRSCDAIFVSASFENAAADVFGKPAVGPAFASERPGESVPDTVVVRVLEDGPVPMGPYVYIDAPDGEITTLLCRCMASQVDRIVSTAYYNVRPLEELGDRATLQCAGALKWSNVPLDQRVRWPGRDPSTGRNSDD